MPKRFAFTRRVSNEILRVRTLTNWPTSKVTQINGIKFLPLRRMQPMSGLIDELDKDNGPNQTHALIDFNTNSAATAAG